MAGGDLKALRDRLRAASGSDRELDARIEAWEAGRTFLEWHAPYYTSEEVAGSNGGDSSPVTASIDAALALCERKLPGWTYILDTRPVDSFQFPEWIGRVRVRLYAPGLFAATFDPPVVRDSHAEAFGATAPLAILLALLEAMIGKERGDG